MAESDTERLIPAAYSQGYSVDVDIIRELEYPLLNGTSIHILISYNPCSQYFPHRTETTYLDHAGTTPYAKSMIEAYSRDLSSNLFGNPHSISMSSQTSTQRTDDIRLRVLRFF